MYGKFGFCAYEGGIKLKLKLNGSAQLAGALFSERPIAFIRFDIFSFCSSNRLSVLIGCWPMFNLFENNVKYSIIFCWD